MQPWSASEQQQLEQLARQVLPPGVAQYEIIRAGGVDGSGVAAVKGSGGDATAAATVDSGAAFPSGGGAQQVPSAAGKKKPVTFVILEERPDGTVRVRGIEKKQHGGGPSDGGDPDVVGSSNDEQLQQLVDKLNRGELRLPSVGQPSPSKTGAPDSAAVASTTASTPLPAYVPPFPSTVQPTGSSANNKRREPPPPAYFPTVAPQTTTTALHQHQYQNFFIPTVVPTEAVAVATTVGQQHSSNYHHHQQQQQRQQQQQQQQQSYTPPTITTSTSYNTPAPVNSTYFNNKAAKEGMFSGALRRRGYYAMAKYMRQAGVDAVLEETG